MSDSEIQSWISEQATNGRPALTLSRGNLSNGQVLFVRLALGVSSATAANEQLVDLMMDMRLLGLRPAVVSRTDSRSSAEPRR